VYDVDGRWYLMDFPGYGFASASRGERAGFQHLLRDYVERRERLAGVVWLLDIRRDPSPDDLDMNRRLADRRIPVLAAITKLDKVARGERPLRMRAILDAVNLPEDQCLPTSARTREGIQDLRDSIEALVDRRSDR